MLGSYLMINNRTILIFFISVFFIPFNAFSAGIAVNFKGGIVPNSGDVLIVSSYSQIKRYHSSLLIGEARGKKFIDARIFEKTPFYNIFSDSKSKTIKNIEKQNIRKNAGNEEVSEIKEFKKYKEVVYEGDNIKFKRIIVFSHAEYDDFDSEQKLMRFEIGDFESNTFGVSPKSIGEKISQFVGEDTEIELIACVSCDKAPPFIEGLKSKGVDTFKLTSTEAGFGVRDTGEWQIFTGEYDAFLDISDWIKHQGIKNFYSSISEEEIYKDFFKRYSVSELGTKEYSRDEGYEIYKQTQCFE